jgi:anti-sigma factor RsiW
MTCKEIQAVIVEYLDQTLDAAAMNAVAAHLATCEECRHETQELRELMQAMGGSELQQPGPGLRENFQLLLQSELNMVVADKLLHEGDEGEESVGMRTERAEGDRGSTGSRREGMDIAVRRGDRGGAGGGEGVGGGYGDAGDGRGKGMVIKKSFPLWHVAAAVLLLFGGGIGVGVLLSSRKASNPNPSSNTPEQLVTMQKEIKEMKEVLMFSLIGDESASQRIKAVSYTEEMSNPDQKVIETLVSTLNHDKNVNVRLAALYSLGSWADNRMVRDSLVASLPKQTEPLIQVMLINLLAEKKDSRIVAPIQDILSNKKTLPVVKDAAEKSLKTL